MEASRFFATLCLFFLQTGCAKILGIEEKHFVAEVSTCPLVAEGTAAVRLMNAIPGSLSLDVCEREPGKKTWGKAWFASHAQTCGAGVAYSQFTRDLGIRAGSHDFKLVPAGSNCDSSGLELSSVTIHDGQSVTLMAYGAAMQTGRLSLLPNRVEPKDKQPLRFVHALNDAGPLSAGLVTSLEAPTIETPLFNDVAFGQTAVVSSGLAAGEYDDVDEFGYVSIGGLSVSLGDLRFGAQQAAPGSLVVASKVPLTRGHAYTIFALGSLSDVQSRAKLWSCDEDSANGLFLSCGNPKQLLVEVFNPNLTDAFTPWVAERTDPAIAAVLAENADLLCVTDLYDPRLVSRLRNDASGVFTQRAFSDDVPSERTTPLVATAAGLTPTYPEAACTGHWADILRQWIECTKASPGCTVQSPSGAGENVLASPGVAATNCMFGCGLNSARLMIDELRPGGDESAAACYWCAMTHLASYESLEHAYERCTAALPMPDRRHLAFSGSSGLAVLGRQLSFGSAELVQLPSSGWQRAALRVPVVADNGASFDFWCASVRFPDTEEVLNYAGPYGTWGPNGNVEEQAYEIASAVNAIGARVQGTGIPSVIAIVANAGQGYVDPKTQQTLVYPLLPDLYQLMASVWSPLVSRDYVPTCTFCGDEASNPLNSLSPEYRFWTSHLFGIGIDQSRVTSTARTFTNPAWSFVNESGTTVTAPVSQFFGLRSDVTVTQ